MQVVYCGGSTPSPSPRLQRKTEYGRPLMPGYMNHVHSHILVQRSREKFTEGDITLRDSIPAMSKGVAVVCLILNIIIPGSGTLTAGLSVLCCSHVRPKGDSKGHCIWINAGVALVQFLLTFLFLLGWIWSIMWGVAFLSMSGRYYYRHEKGEKKKYSEKEKSRKKATHKHRQYRGTGAGANCSTVKQCRSHQYGRDHEFDRRLKEQLDRHLDHHLLASPKEYVSDSLSVQTCASSNAGSAASLVSKQSSPTSSYGYSPVSVMYDMESDMYLRPPTITVLHGTGTNHNISPDSVSEAGSKTVSGSECGKTMTESSCSSSTVTEPPRSKTHKCACGKTITESADIKTITESTDIKTITESTDIKTITESTDRKTSESSSVKTVSESSRSKTTSNGKTHHVTKVDNKVNDGKLSPQAYHHNLKPVSINDMPFTFLTVPKEQNL